MNKSRITTNTKTKGCSPTQLVSHHRDVIAVLGLGIFNEPSFSAVPAKGGKHPKYVVIEPWPEMKSDFWGEETRLFVDFDGRKREYHLYWVLMADVSNFRNLEIFAAFCCFGANELSFPAIF